MVGSRIADVVIGCGWKRSQRVAEVQIPESGSGRVCNSVRGVSSSLAQKPWGLLCASCGAGSEIHLKRCLHRPGFLLEFGQLPRSQGKTAKDIAREHQRDDLVQILEGPANCHHTETFARVPQEWAQREPTLPLDPIHPDLWWLRVPRSKGSPCFPKGLHSKVDSFLRPGPHGAFL